MAHLLSIMTPTRLTVGRGWFPRPAVEMKIALAIRIIAAISIDSADLIITPLGGPIGRFLAINRELYL